jgi:hypothetical protein
MMYVTIYAADRSTEVCACPDRLSAVVEINHQLQLAGRPDLCIDLTEFGNSPVTDEFRDDISRRLGEDPDSGAEAILPLACTADCRDWDVCEHLARPSAENLRWLANVATCRNSGGLTIYSWPDVDYVHVIGTDDEADGTQHRYSVAMPREEWRRLVASERDSSDNCIIATPVPYICAEDGWPIVRCDLATEKGRGYLVAVEPATGSHRACFAWYGRSERYPDAKAALWGLLETNAIVPAPAAH